MITLYNILSKAQVLLILALMSSCSLPDISVREFLRPVRVLFNQEQNYWTDQIELKGETGIERVYYKNGRPALERYYDEEGLLKTITYFGRTGEPIRLDSLVYSGDVLISGYYFSEPDHHIVLKFLNYKKQGQLSQRSWFGSVGELLSRELFLFDRKGQRQSRMIFDGNDSLLYSETFKPGTGDLEIQNIYTLDGHLTSQVRHHGIRPTVRYEFDLFGTISRISQLYPTGTPAWTSDLLYGKDGKLERSNFSVNGKFLFTYLGDMEFNWQTVRTWKHPAQPGHTDVGVIVGHRDPFVIETGSDTQNNTTLEYRLPKSGALFKRSISDKWGQPLSDTLYTNQGQLQPANVISYDDEGRLKSEVTYTSQGLAKWKHTWFRDDAGKVIREELTSLPDTFESAVTRVYDTFGSPAFSEHFIEPDSLDGSWVFYHGGGVNKTLLYNDKSELTESWLFRPAGDTTQHSRFVSLAYIKIESKYGRRDSLLSQRRFTEDDILDWELFFNSAEQLSQETYRKKDGSIYREVSYDHNASLIKSSTFAPLELSVIEEGDELRGELSSQVITRLNPNGEIVQVVSRNSSGGVEWEKRYAFRGGRLVKSAQLGSDGKPHVISSYSHTDQGQILEETALDPEGNLIHTVEHRYNEKQELIWRMFSSVLTGTVSSNRYYYDDTGRLQRDEIIESKHFIEAVEYEYFPQFHLRIATHLEPGGEVIRQEVENYFEQNVFALSTIE